MSATAQSAEYTSLSKYGADHGSRSIEKAISAHLYTAAIDMRHSQYQERLYPTAPDVKEAAQAAGSAFCSLYDLAWEVLPREQVHAIVDTADAEANQQHSLVATVEGSQHHDQPLPGPRRTG